MKSIPGHILGVEILRPETKSRLDGSVVTEFLRESPGAISYGWTKEELVSAESAFTAQPRFTRRAPQETIVSCRIGEVFIATIDLRIDSPTFCDWQGFYLQEGDERTLFVPPGVAVGWQVCSSDAQVYFRYAIDPNSCDWAWLEHDELEFEIEWPAYPSVVAEQALPSCEFNRLLDDELPSLAEFAKDFESSLGPSATLPKQSTTDSKPSKHASQTEEEYFDAETSDSSDTNLVDETKHTEFLLVNDSRRNTRTVSYSRQKPKLVAHSTASSPRPILLVGSTGQLGQDLGRHLAKLGTVIGASRSPDLASVLPIPMQLDISRPAGLRQAIRSARPSLIINAAGMSDIDEAESQPRIAQLVNATAPGILAEEAKAVGAGLIHFCSEQVFDGTLDRPYRENDIPSPLNQHARTKLLGTEAIQDIGCSHMILRCGWLYSTRHDNYVRRIMDLISYRSAITLPSDHTGSPTSTDWVSRTLVEVLSRANGRYAEWLEDNGGLFHLAPLGYGNRVEVADQVIATCRQLGMPLTISNVAGLPLARLPGIAQIPANCKLDPTLFAAKFGLSLPTWQSELNSQLATILAERMSIANVS